MVIGGVVGGVVVVIAASVWAAVYFSKPRPAQSRLIGTWQSDANATIAEMRKKKAVTEKQEEALRKLFGRLRITYAPATLTTDMDGVQETQRYQIVSEDGDSIVIREWFPASKKKEQQVRIRFIDKDTYWVDVEQFEISECFHRVE
jgi:hypothetical protein